MGNYSIIKLTTRGFLAIILFSMLLLGLGSCGGGGDGGGGFYIPPSPPPFIYAELDSFPPGSEPAGFQSAFVFVIDDNSGNPITNAMVTMNGVTLTYNATFQDYEGNVTVAPGGAVRVNVTVGGNTYTASGTQFATYPTIFAPASGATWVTYEANTVTWSEGAPTNNAQYDLGVFDADNGQLIWPTDNFLQPVQIDTTSYSIPSNSLTVGNRLVIVDISTFVDIPNAVPGSLFVISGLSNYVPITVTNGTNVLAVAPYPSHLIVSSGNLFWSDATDTPVKKIPVTGGTATPLARNIGMPESLTVYGQYVYWITGNRLKKTSLDGAVTTVLAEGTRDSGTTDIIVDNANVYWVNTVSTLSCSPACTWVIQKVPLDGSDLTTLATTSAEIVALASDSTTIYWEQQGMGPVSPDGNGSTDSAIKKVPKAGGVPTIVVNGLLNGLTPPPPPGYIPGNWFARGSIAVQGTDLFFADTDFYDSYRLMKVSVSGGSVTVLSDVTTNDSSNFIRGIAVAGTAVFWIDKNSVNAIPINGGTSTVLVGGIYSTADIAVNGTSVIWTETECCAVRQNGSVKTVPVGGGAVTTLISALDNPGAVAINASKAYWVEGGPYGAMEGYGRIAQIPLSGGSDTTIVTGIFSASPPIATDGVYVYIADKWRIKRVPVSGGQLVTMVPGTEKITDIATDGVNVYWIDQFANVFKVPVGGGVPVTLTTAFTGGPAGPIRQSNGYVYWMDHFDTIKKVPTGGGTTVTVAPGLPFLSDFVVDGTYVYFSEQDTGLIRKISVNGGAITTLFQGTPFTYRILAVDNQNLYWIDQSDVGRIPINGGDPTFLVLGTVQSDPYFPGSIAIDDTSAYWTEVATGLIKIATPK